MQSQLNKISPGAPIVLYVFILVNAQKKITVQRMENAKRNNNLIYFGNINLISISQVFERGLLTRRRFICKKNSFKF